ncbi:MAG: hypothetical protein RL346_327 [Verrucomicrobiota bacterium]
MSKPAVLPGVNFKSSFLAILAFPFCLHAGEKIIPGATEDTPSRSHYFTWINNTNEGPTAHQTKVNLEFFQWLKDEYGMILDIYAFDAGAIDAPSYYGKPDTRKFKGQFPQGFGPFAEQAKVFGGRLGVWLGPDGFGNTAEEEKARIDFLTSLGKDHHFQLFKMDAVCGQLRDEKQEAFIRLMTEVRKHTPDLILLNHRLNLGEGVTHATTFLWEGAETYIDVHMANNRTATHNRAAALSRGLPPELKRLAEDHGVCLSSSLDFWEDDLILQGFNRSMILAPQLYGSPWFLRDDEYPKLARIFNIHRKYRDILTKGIILPKETYGENAVSRGNEKTRLITLRNLTWEPVTHRIALDSSIGLTSDGKREVRLLHPYEEVIGKNLSSKQTVEVIVHPFRAVLVIASTQPISEPSLEKGAYQVVKHIEGKPVEIDKLTPIALKQPWHRKLADLTPSDLPSDWEGLYETTMFAADNNALELRSLKRSGPTNIPAVENGRNAFLDQPLMKSRALSDQFMFDGDLSTVMDAVVRNKDMRIAKGCLRVDFSKPEAFDRIAIHTQALDSTLIENELLGAQFSRDLITWTQSDEAIIEGNTLNIYPPSGEWRYFRMQTAPERIAEIEAWNGNNPVSRKNWRANNFFAHPTAVPVEKTWSANIKIDEITPTSYLCVAVEGKHGIEGCYATLRVGERLIGSADRASSYPSNTWEYPVRNRETGYTYFFPVDSSMLGKDIELVLLGMKGGGQDLKPTVWLTARDLPFTKERVTIKK